MPLKVTATAAEGDKHTADINQIGFYNGKLFSASEDGKVKVWGQDLKLIETIEAHSSPVFSLAASEHSLFTCSGDGTVKSWNLNSYGLKQVIDEDEDVEFWKLFYGNDHLYAGDDGGSIRVYKSEVFYRLFTTSSPVKDLAVRGDFVFSAEDTDVIVSDVQVGGEKFGFQNKENFTGRGPIVILDDKAIFFSKDGKEVIVNTIDEKQYIKKIARVNVSDKGVTGAVAVNWGGNSLLFTGGEDQQVKQWKLDGANVQAEGSVAIDFVPSSIVVGETGKVYVGGAGGSIARIEI